jgi:hypothetical protein
MHSPEPAFINIDEVAYQALRRFLVAPTYSATSLLLQAG